MILIGERINGMFANVRGAIRNRDARAIYHWAERQTEASAHYLDVNTGPVPDPAEAMGWLVSRVQEVSPLPLCLDSTSLDTIEAGLRRCRRPALINSCPAVRERMERAFPLARQFGAGLIGLTMDERGIPRDAESRSALAMELVATADEFSFPLENLFVDAVLLPVSAAQDQAIAVLRTIDLVKTLSDPPPRTILGLSNISQGGSDRSLLNRTYLVMAISAGLDAAILDVTDAQLGEALATAKILLNQVIYAPSYLKGGRFG